jgi:tetratricopeptide (TPR) repeat protein
MAIKGSLSAASLGDVCQLLSMGQKSGCLSVADGSRFGQICFEHGRITHARIFNRRDRLGDSLVRAGLLSRSQLDAVLRQQEREPDRRLGDLLASGGFVPADALGEAIRVQVRETVYHLLTWTRGHFFFDPDAPPQDTVVPVSIDPGGLLLEAARRIDEWSVIEKKVPSLETRFVADVGEDDLPEGGITQEQRRILPLLERGRSVEELVEETGMSEFDVGKAIHGLVQAGIARRADRQRSMGSESSGSEHEPGQRENLGVAFYTAGMLGDAAREFRRVLELDPANHTARHHLALIDLRQGRQRGAVRHLRVLLEQHGPSYSAYMNLALALRCRGRYDDALMVLGEAESLKPGLYRTLLARAETLFLAGEYAAAAAALDRCAELLPADGQPGPAYFYLTALIRAVAGRPAEAGAVVSRGLILYPSSAPLLLLSGALHERRGDVEEAERVYQRALIEDDALPQAYRCVGDVLYRRGAYADALEHYRRAVMLDPRLGDEVLARIANLHYRERRVGQAIEFWRKALRLNPRNDTVRQNLEAVGRDARE